MRRAKTYKRDKAIAWQRRSSPTFVNPYHEQAKKEQYAFFVLEYMRLNRKQKYATMGQNTTNNSPPPQASHTNLHL